MKKLADVYEFWDLIAQEAYSPKTKQLIDKTWDIFNDCDSKKTVWLFACNAACKKIIECFGNDWNIGGILDNSSVMQGKDYAGYRVYAPSEIVNTLDSQKDVIVLALRLNADIVAKQIYDLGFQNVYSFGVLLSGMDPFSSFINEINDLMDRSEIKDVVLMESMNDFDGNTGALYEYLKRSGSKHRFVWLCKSQASNSKYFGGDDLKLYPGKSVEDLKEFMRLRALAKWEIWECDPIRKVRPDQINVFLQHYGMGYKQVAHLYNSPDYVDFVLTTTELVWRFESKSITYSPTSKFIFGELPRNDVLLEAKWNELSKIVNNTYDKVIMWAPTLRESRYYNRVDSDIEYPYGVSLIYSEQDMELLNDELKKRNMLLIIKIHPRQKLNFRERQYSNILYLNGDTVKKIHSYKLLSQMDGFITDYSSMVFDYMLLDRPCAWVLEDREHYKIEYLMDDPDEYMPGEKIYNIEGMFRFLDDVHANNDPYAKERREICSRCNPPVRGKGSEALAEKLGL